MKEGIFAINKPKGPTSHDIINQLRRITGEKRIGHAGTLDPRASGVLVVAIGRESTKKLNEVVKKEKEYRAVIKFGEESTTDDSEGAKTTISCRKKPSEEEVENVLKKFNGEIMQTPPVYSAIKVNGRPAHRRVRKGETVKLEPRKVLIKDIALVKYDWPIIEIRVVTGQGVYIRSLARDIGRELKVGGYLFSLERTRVGEFKIEEAVSVESLGG